MATRAIIVFLLSVSLIGLELVWTRLFSAEFFYTFAFLILSLAIAGLGLGALYGHLRPHAGGRHAFLLVLASLFALAGPPLVFWIAVDFSALGSSRVEIPKLVLTVSILGLPYVSGGMVLSNIFRHAGKQLPQLYAADLIGAGLGVIAAVVAMNRLGTGLAAPWLVLPILVAAFIAGGDRPRGFSLLLSAVVVFGGPFAGGLLELPREERAPVIYKHWDAMAKVKLYDFGGRYRGINVDNVANSPVIPFDGDFDALDPDEFPINVGYLIARFDSCRFLSLGSGGGSDVIQALAHDVASVHAVEVNPHVNRMMLEGDPDGYLDDSAAADSTGGVVTCAEYSGFLFRDPRVTVVSEDGRSYVRRHRGEFDVIFSLSSNTWAALASGSFALAENYLFTTEAFIDYWHALSDSGFLSMEHQVYMPRLVSEVGDALERIGVESPGDHFAVYELPGMRRKLLLLSRRPLTDEIRYRAYGPLTPERQSHIRLVYPAPDSLADNLYQRIATQGWRSQADSVAIDLSPCTDDRPFTAQMGLWKNLSAEGLKNVRWVAEFRGFPLAKLTIIVILAVALVLLVPLTLLPYLGRGEKLPAAGWTYFFLLGIGFMLVEIVLIQKYAFFIGAPAYSLAVVLGTLLLASGIGSRVATRFTDRAVFLWIVGWILLEALVLPLITRGLTLAPGASRVVITAALIAPLGFFLGMAFPKGGLRVGERVDWGFAVNGVASVVGGSGAVLLALTQGFTATLLVAAIVYALAGFALSRVPRRWTSYGI